MLELGGLAREPGGEQRLAQGNRAGHSLTHFLFCFGLSWGAGGCSNPTPKVRVVSPLPDLCQARESLMVGSQSEVTDGIQVFRSHIPHPAPGGLGGKEGGGSDVSVQALCLETMNTEAMLRKWPPCPPRHLTCGVGEWRRWGRGSGGT